MPSNAGNMSLDAKQEATDPWQWTSWTSKGQWNHIRMIIYSNCIEFIKFHWQCPFHSECAVLRRQSENVGRASLVLMDLSPEYSMIVFFIIWSYWLGVPLSFCSSSISATPATRSAAPLHHFDPMHSAKTGYSIVICCTGTILNCPLTSSYCI